MGAQLLALELAPRGIPVLAIHPGAVVSAAAAAAVPPRCAAALLHCSRALERRPGAARQSWIPSPAPNQPKTKPKQMPINTR